MISVQPRRSGALSGVASGIVHQRSVARGCKARTPSSEGDKEQGGSKECLGVRDARDAARRVWEVSIHLKSPHQTAEWRSSLRSNPRKDRVPCTASMTRVPAVLMKPAGGMGTSASRQR